MSVIYEYRCMNGEPIERFYPIAAAPETITCDEHNTIARRQVSNGNFLTFPGSYAAESRKT